MRIIRIVRNWGCNQKEWEITQAKQYTRCSHEAHFYVEVGLMEVFQLDSCEHLVVGRMGYSVLSVNRVLLLGPLRNDSDDSNQPKAQCWFPILLKISKSAASGTGISHQSSCLINYSVSGRELQVTKCQCKVWAGGLRVVKSVDPVITWAVAIKTGYIEMFGWRICRKAFFFLILLMIGVPVWNWSDETRVSPSHCRPQPTRFLAGLCHGNCSCTSMEQHPQTHSTSMLDAQIFMCKIGGLECCLYVPTYLKHDNPH